MIKSEREYNRAVREMLRRVQLASSVDEFHSDKMSVQESEILADCIKREFLIGRVSDSTGEFRTEDGKMHPELLNTLITPRGYAFLKPQKTDVKATVALIVSIVAVVVSIAANLQQIVESFRWLADSLK